jgi:hypothetical protein
MDRLSGEHGQMAEADYGEGEVMSNRGIAQYECLGCGYEWSEKIQPRTPDFTSGTDCKKCGNLYVKWTNYETAFRKNEQPRKSTA